MQRILCFSLLLLALARPVLAAIPEIDVEALSAVMHSPRAEVLLREVTGS